MATSDSSRTKASVDVEFDATRQLLHVRFRGVVSAAEVAAHLDEARRLVASAGPGFSLLTDLTELEEMSIDSVRDLARMMDFYLEKGVKRIVRVIPDPSKDIGFKLLSMTHYRGRVPILTCTTVAEARQTLENG